MNQSIEAYFDIVKLLEVNNIWENTIMYGEPQLGRRGFFSTLGSQKISSEIDTAMWWVLNLADGKNDLATIAQKSKVNWKTLSFIANKLEKAGLLKNLGQL